MCNCGNKRNAFTTGSVITGIRATPKADPAVKMWQDVAFMYTGQSALTITGYISSKKYRFGTGGEVLLIDYRDAAAMMNVPVLKKV